MHNKACSSHAGTHFMRGRGPDHWLSAAAGVLEVVEPTGEFGRLTPLYCILVSYVSRDFIHRLENPVLGSCTQRPLELNEWNGRNLRTYIDPRAHDARILAENEKKKASYCSDR